MSTEIIDAQERLLTSSYDKASAYSKVVLGIGYVGIFAAWGFTKMFLIRNEVLWSALLACISIVFYVVFDVLTMFMASRSVITLAAAVNNPKSFQQAIETHKLNERKWGKRYITAWVICWPISFATGIASAGILLWAFATHLWTGH